MNDLDKCAFILLATAITTLFSSNAKFKIMLDFVMVLVNLELNANISMLTNACQKISMLLFC